MKNIRATIGFGLILVPALAEAGPADILTGDIRLACEAILCLSSGARPGECKPSLARYFGISYKRFSDTIKGRFNFLNLCPIVSLDSKMNTLAHAISRGAGRCDAEYLNANTITWVNKSLISDPEYLANALMTQGTSPAYGYLSLGWRGRDELEQVAVTNFVLPSWCQIYQEHEYTRLDSEHGVARYVGTPERGGHWSDPVDYKAALASYNLRIATENKAILAGYHWRRATEVTPFMYYRWAYRSHLND